MSKKADEKTKLSAIDERLATAEQVEKRISSSSADITKTSNLLKQKTKEFNVAKDSLEEILMKLSQRMEAFEETLLFIMHNIKKNQFLYAHYPDDWVKDYLDIKTGLEKENEYLEQKDGT